MPCFRRHFRKQTFARQRDISEHGDTNENDHHAAGTFVTMATAGENAKTHDSQTRVGNTAQEMRNAVCARVNVAVFEQTQTAG
jgi:hypothetical protein